MTEKRLKSTNSSYNHSHKKSAKSFAKGLDKAETHLIIFSDKRTERHKRTVCSHKVVAVGFHPLHYGAEHRGMKTSARIIFYCRKIAEHYRYAEDNASRQQQQ